MGIWSGAATYRVFRVQGEVPAGFHEPYLQRIRSFTHRDIDIEGDEERTVGWVSPLNILDRDLTRDQVLFGNYLCLTMRVDALRIPREVLSAYVAAAEAELRSTLNRERLGKMERLEVKERVRAELRRKVLPAFRGFQMVWNILEGRLYFGSHNRRVLDEFVELFGATFELRLVPLAPYTAALFESFAEDELIQVARLVPASFVP